MSCIRERMKRNGTAEEGGPISSHSLTRGIKRYYVLDASNRTHVTLPCCMHYCYDVSNAVIEPVSKQFHAVQFNYFVWLLFLDRFAPRIQRHYFHFLPSISGNGSSAPVSNGCEKKWSESERFRQNVPWYACILAKLRANVFFSFSLFLEITVPCYYLVVSINVSSSKRNETTTFEVLTRIIASPYFKLRKMKANLKKKKKNVKLDDRKDEFCAMISRATMILKDARRGLKEARKEFVIFALKFADKSASIEKRFLGHYRGTA